MGLVVRRVCRVALRLRRDPWTRRSSLLHPDRGLRSLLRGDAADTTFVFTPGYVHDTIEGLRLVGADHDTVALPSADFASFAQVLRDTQSTPNGALIHDNTSGDTLLLAGVSKTELAQHKADFSFHA